VKAARALIARLDGDNQLCAEDSRFMCRSASAGAASSTSTREDLFGDEVNLASKLGEDLAQRSEVLLTAAAQAQAAAAGIETREAGASISGLPLVYHRLI
jgi:hypothetical protein